MFPLLIDRQVQGAAAGTSLLGLPLGARSLIEQYAKDLRGVTSNPLWVMPTFQPQEHYARNIAAGTQSIVEVMTPADLAVRLRTKEPADRMLVIDAARMPAVPPDLGDMVAEYSRYGGAVHLVAVGAAADQTRERIDQDGQGRVRRVQRLYGQVNWPEVAGRALFASLVPVGALTDLKFDSLEQLRGLLSQNGVFSRDEAIAIDIVDLTQESGLLGLNERLITYAMHNGVRSTFSEKSPEVLVGPNCQIHPSARLVGPLIIHDGVTIAECATIIGPGVVGANSHIEQGATVAHSLLATGTRIASQATASHRVVSGRCCGTQDGGSYFTLPAASPRIDPHLDRAPIGGTVANVQTRRRRAHQAIKRVGDVVLSSLALIALLPVFIVVAILIKLESRGPVFFSHLREQVGGREFPCVKFRTMVSDAHEKQRELYANSEVDGPQFKMAKDPRVTRIGTLLRMTNIDELPQLFNVLVGHMSLVGPRPSPFRENQICVPWRRARLSVRPGITGLWQVCRSDDRSQGDFHEWIYYDIAYVRHFSIWLDLKILVATVLTCGGKWSVPQEWLISSAHHDVPNPPAEPPVPPVPGASSPA